MNTYNISDFPHGIMFHHFTDEGIHPRGQGAIDANETEDMIKFLDPARILCAQEWMERGQKGTLKPHHLCITFDDSLLCQYEVAHPVLQHYNLTGFYFVYTSVLQGNVEKLEIYRYFRTVAFETIDDFYAAFFAALDIVMPGKREKALSGVNIDDYLKDYSFFTRNDRIFRFLRDEVLTVPEYNAIMDAMMEEANFNEAEAAKKLWMSQDQLKDLAVNDNIIGLHSHTHPLTLGRLPKEQQQKEYQQNYEAIEAILRTPPLSMSHPSNSYNEDTIDILDELGVLIGFRADMIKMDKRSPFELPREDHAHILRAMNQR